MAPIRSSWKSRCRSSSRASSSSEPTLVAVQESPRREPARRAGGHVRRADAATRSRTGTRPRPAPGTSSRAGPSSGQPGRPGAADGRAAVGARARGPGPRLGQVRVRDQRRLREPAGDLHLPVRRRGPARRRSLSHAHDTHPEIVSGDGSLAERLLRGPSRLLRAARRHGRGSRAAIPRWRCISSSTTCRRCGD